MLIFVSPRRLTPKGTRSEIRPCNHLQEYQLSTYLEIVMVSIMYWSIDLQGIYTVYYNRNQLGTVSAYAMSPCHWYGLRNERSYEVINKDCFPKDFKVSYHWWTQVWWQQTAVVFINVSSCYENKANNPKNCNHWKLKADFLSWQKSLAYSLWIFLDNFSLLSPLQRVLAAWFKIFN